MILTENQQAILDGKEGTFRAKMLKTLVMYGKLSGANKMVPVTCQYNYTALARSMKNAEPIYALAEQIIKKEELSVFWGEFTPGGEAFPAEEDILSAGDPVAVVYANSVLGARCNLNPAGTDLMGMALGMVPSFGLLTEEGRKANAIISVETLEKPDPNLLAAAIAETAKGDVVYIMGMDKYIDSESEEDYLAKFSAAMASEGFGMYHMAGITPEAKKSAEACLADKAEEYVVDDLVLNKKAQSHGVGGECK